MYNVILVDDEPWIMVDLVSLLNWEEYGFHISAQFTQPSQALRYAKKTRPDVVIVDICMPGLNGLDFAQQIQISLPDCTIAFVSAYQEFAYFKRALQIKAFDYLLKPVSCDELSKFLIRLKDHVIQQKQKAENRIRTQFEILLMKAILDDQWSNKDANIMEKEIIPVGHQMIVVAVRHIVDCSSFVNQTQSKGYHVFPIQIGKMFIALMSFPVEDNNTEDLQTLCLHYCEEDPSIYIGYSNPIRSISELKKAFTQATIATEAHFFCREIHVSPFYQNSKACRQMKEEINNLSGKEDILPYMLKLTEQFKSGKFNTDECFQVFTTMFFHVSAIMKEKITWEWKDRESFLSCFESLENYVQYINEFLTFSASSDSSGEKKMIDVICEDIRQKYALPLRLQTYAEQFHYHHCYLSQLFKLTTGKTFSNYLIDYRMKMAEEMMESSNLSLYEISENVGYEDYFHFSKLYKKYRGMAPTKYRSSIVAEKEQ